MIILVDVGNTNTKFAVCDSVKILFSFTMSTKASKSPDEYEVFFKVLFQDRGFEIKSLRGAILMSVAPSSNQSLICFFKRLGIGVRVLGVSDFSEIQTGTKSLYIGTDRLAELVGARDVICSGGLLVIGAGTATTFNLLSPDNVLFGHAIAPGLHAMARSLRESTCLLPLIGFTKKPNFKGESTIEAVESGVWWGYISMIEGMIQRLSLEYDEKPNIIISANESWMLGQVLSDFGTVISDLALRGMFKISANMR